MKKKIEELDVTLQRANKASKMSTVKQVQKKQVDKDQISFNPEKLGKLVVAILDCKQVDKRLKRILKATQPAHLNQDTTMKFLYSLTMILGNGQRGNTVSLMKIQEFEDAAKDEDQVVFCAEHKTMTSSRTAPIVFPMPKIYRAIQKYIDLFR